MEIQFPCEWGKSGIFQKWIWEKRIDDGTRIPAGNSERCVRSFLWGESLILHLVRPFFTLLRTFPFVSYGWDVEQEVIESHPAPASLP
jgi:hypothetical protein